MRNVEELIRETLASTSDMPAVITGSAVRRVAHHRRVRTQAIGTLVAVGTVAVAARSLPARHASEVPTAQGPAGNSASAPAAAAAQPTGTIESSSSATSQTPAVVDPVVLEDVVAGVFPMPGKTQRRTIHVMLGVRSIANVACGGQPAADLESTADRFDQSKYADLDLIAEKGFSEQVDEFAKVGASPDRPCVKAVLPSYQAWYALAGDWGPVSESAVASAKVAAAKPTVTFCFRERGITVDPADPVGSFFGLTDGGTATLTDAGRQARLRQLAASFMACSRGYFDAIESELRPHRASMVERHRALLERFAAELTAAGYKP